MPSWRARKTSAMPPAPRRLSSWYFPRRSDSQGTGDVSIQVKVRGMTALLLVVLAAADGGTQVPDERARGRLFDSLVSDVRRLHVFTPQIEANLGRRWDEDLPGLKDEMQKA